MYYKYGSKLLTLNCRTTYTYTYMSYRTANFQMLHFIYYSTNIRTEYFKHAAHSPFFSLQNAVHFIMLPFFGSCVIHILYTECAKIKKKKIRRQRVNELILFSFDKQLLYTKVYILKPIEA